MSLKTGFCCSPICRDTTVQAQRQGGGPRYFLAGRGPCCKVNEPMGAPGFPTRTGRRRSLLSRYHPVCAALAGFERRPLWTTRTTRRSGSEVQFHPAMHPMIRVPAPLANQDLLRKAAPEYLNRQKVANHGLSRDTATDGKSRECGNTTRPGSSMDPHSFYPVSGLAQR